MELIMTKTYVQVTCIYLAKTYPGIHFAGGYVLPVTTVHIVGICTSTTKGLYIVYFQCLLISLRELFGTAIFVFVGCFGTPGIFTEGLIYMVLQASAEISRYTKVSIHHQLGKLFC